MIQKVIVPAAGLGTRLFPATKEQPKEMLPIFSKTDGGEMIVKPVVQLVFEQLYHAGIENSATLSARANEASKTTSHLTLNA